MLEHGDIEQDLVPMDPAAAPGLALLRALWGETLAASEATVDDAIHEIITCRVVSIRYALLTQLLGKTIDPSRDALSIQRGDAETAQSAGRWDARSFCSANVVPWVSETGQVLGTSPDPYVNNPLRRARLDADAPLRNRNLWNKLSETLDLVQERDCPEFTESRLRACLTSLAVIYRQLNVEFDVPQRISLEATSGLIESFLNEPSGGERPQVVTAALMKTIGYRFGIFDQVVRLGINEADAASASSGDIICYFQDALVLAVEVKDRAIEMHDVETAIGKARRNDIREILFATATQTFSIPAIADRIEREFALGINVYHLSIDALLRVVLSIAGESSRTQFLTLVGQELNDRVTQPSHKLAWQKLLQNL